MPVDSRTPLVRRLRRAARMAIDRVPVLNRMVLTSAGYRVLTRLQTERLAAAGANQSWESAARRQQGIYERLLREMYAGSVREDFRVAAQAVVQAGIPNPGLLEVGCGNGYFSEILGTLVPGGVRYSGLDYSQAMIASARQRYPGADFLVGDTTRMPFGDGSFDIVMDGVSLMHILDYRRAIEEIGRVASRFAVLHCLPVFEHGPTAFLTKYAYGRRVPEIIFGAEEIRDILDRTGLDVVRTLPSIPYDVFHATGRHSTFLTYLCRKRAAGPDGTRALRSSHTR